MAKKKSQQEGGGRYAIRVEHGSDVREASGDDLAGLLTSLGMTGVKAKVVLTVSCGGKSVASSYLPRVARRFLGTRVYAESFAKKLSVLFER